MRAGFQKPHTRKGAVDLAAAHVFVGEEGSGGGDRTGAGWGGGGGVQGGSLRCSLSPTPHPSLMTDALPLRLPLRLRRAGRGQVHAHAPRVPPQHGLPHLRVRAVLRGRAHGVGGRARGRDARERGGAG